MFQFDMNVSEEVKAADEAAVAAIESDLADLWAAQVASISAQVAALPDEQKGKFLAPIARLPIGIDLEPEGLSEYGKELFDNARRRAKNTALKPLYP